jgi:hypothetical protein
MTSGGPLGRITTSSAIADVNAPSIASAIAALERIEIDLNLAI